jgi:hypothetical protein
VGGFLISVLAVALIRNIEDDGTSTVARDERYGPARDT